MGKYKFVGYINFLFGLIQLALPILLLVSVAPRLTKVYSSFQTNNQPDQAMLYGALVFLFILGFINILLGIMGFKEMNEKEKVFQCGIIVAVITFFLMGALISFITSSIISPLYNVTNQF